MKRISYYENDRDMGESFKSESLDEIVSWFRDSYKFHIGASPDEECVGMLVGTGGVCCLIGDIEYEWIIDNV